VRFKWKEPFIVTCRVKGSNGRIRELSSALDFNFAYCCIYKQDAIDLGYSEVSFRPEDWEALRPDRVPRILGLRGIEIGTTFNLNEISIGKLVAKDVETIALKLDLPLMYPVDMILGQSFLKNFKLIANPKAGYLALL
jgi:hypothetical protein